MCFPFCNEFSQASKICDKTNKVLAKILPPRKSAKNMTAVKMNFAKQNSLERKADFLPDVPAKIKKKNRTQIKHIFYFQ